MSLVNSAPKLLWDGDKPGNLTPNDGYKFAILLSVPRPPRSQPLKLLGMTLSRPLRIMAGLGPWGGGRFHQSPTPHYITFRDLHPRDPLLDDWPLLPRLLATRSPTK